MVVVPLLLREQSSSNKGWCLAQGQAYPSDILRPRFKYKGVLVSPESHWQEQILVPKHGEGIKLSLPLPVSTRRRMVKIPAQSRRGFNFLFPLAMEMLLVIQSSGEKKR